MTKSFRIGLIGDYNIEVKAHLAIPRAVALASQTKGYDVEMFWLPTPHLESNAEEDLSLYDAFWCVPGSPYASMNGALNAIRFAREHKYPYLGTCAGFQHAIIEYARNVLGLTEADHTESNPTAAIPIISPLACSLVEAQGSVLLLPNSRIAAIYGSSETVERYFCSYGFNSTFKSLLEQSEMHITGVDSDGAARVVELAHHPFFIGTLFQPELSAFTDVTHPIIIAFLQAVVETSPRDGAVSRTSIGLRGV
jgi:CTP synthase (UTP-ammonia lyase)